MDPRLDCSQEQADLDLHCLSKRFQNISLDDESRQLVVICALRVNKCESRVRIYGLDLHEMHARLRESNNLLYLYQIDRT